MIWFWHIKSFSGSMMYKRQNFFSYEMILFLPGAPPTRSFYTQVVWMSDVHGITWPDKLTISAHPTSQRGPMRRQQDFLKLTDISSQSSSRSHACNNFSRPVTVGVKSKISSTYSTTWNLPERKLLIMCMLTYLQEIDRLSVYVVCNFALSLSLFYLLL